MPIAMEDIPLDVPIPYKCDKSYDPTFEICKYFLQLCYLVPGAILHISVLRAIFLSRKKSITENSFFIIFAMDCLASLYLILIEIFWYRIMRYFMPFGEFFGNLLNLPSTNQRYFYVIYQYARGAKSVIQIFVTVNRMTCVIIPMKHAKFWKYGIPITIITTLVVPLSVLYNPIFGRYYPGSINGGIITRFTRPILAANVAGIHLVFVIIAIIFTIICTAFTLFGLLSLSHRIKKAEKSLCFASFIHSAAFFIVGIVQTLLALTDNFDENFVNFLLVTLTFCFDFLNVFTPLIMILVSSQLRSQVIKKFYSSATTSSKVESIRNPNNNVYPSNASTSHNGRC